MLRALRDLVVALVVILGLAFLAGVGLERRGRVREQERTLNPTGVLVLAAILLLVLGGVFDTILSSG